MLARADRRPGCAHARERRLLHATATAVRRRAHADAWTSVGSPSRRATQAASKRAQPRPRPRSIRWRGPRRRNRRRRPRTRRAAAANQPHATNDTAGPPRRRSHEPRALPDARPQGTHVRPRPRGWLVQRSRSARDPCSATIRVRKADPRFPRDRGHQPPPRCTAHPTAGPRQPDTHKSVLTGALG